MKAVHFSSGLALLAGLAFGVAGSEIVRYRAESFHGLDVVRTWREGEESHLYRFPVAAGQFVRVVAEQRSSDVVVEVFAPGDTSPSVVDGLTYATGSDEFEWVAGTSGQARVRIVLGKAVGSKAGYRLAISAPRPAGPRERLRAAFWNDFLLGISRRDAVGDAALLRALRSAERARAPGLAARVHDRLGRRLPRSDPEAVRHLRAAADLAEDPALRASALHKLASVFAETSRQTEAEAVYLAEYRLSRTEGDRFVEASALEGLAQLAVRRGEFEEAHAFAAQRQRIWRQLGDRESQVNTAYLAATAALSLGDPEQAMRDLESGLALDVSNPKLRVDLLDSLSLAHRRLGQWELARRAGEQAIALALRLNSPEREAACRATLGGMELDLGRTRRALGYLLPAETIYRRRVDDPSSLAYVVGLLGAAASRQGDLPLALSRFDEAIEGYRALGDGDGRASVLALRAEALRRAGRLDEAGVDLERAIEIVEGLRSKMTPAARATLWADRHRFFEALVDLRVAQGRPDAAFDASERARARTLLDEVSGRGTSPPRRLAEIRASLAPGDVLLDFWLGAERSFVWIVRSTGLAVSVLPAGREIEAASHPVIQGLGLPPGRVLGARRGGSTEKLARILLGPIATRLDGDRFAIVPDGALFGVPFAALPLPGASTRLVDRGPVVTLPSASLALAIRAEVARRPPPPDGLLAVGDPVFGCPDDRLPCGSKDPATHGDTVRAVLASGPEGRALLGTDLPRIASTGAEVAAIGRLARGVTVTRRVGFAASRNGVLGARLERYRILHFATHGLVDPVRPERSGLALARLDATGAEIGGDTFLRLGDLAGRRLGAELVSLSACDSALGRQKRGEGPQSLGRAFLAAGAANALVSLWRVDDAATEALMVDFYRRLLEKGEAPAAALRGAQLAIRSRPGWGDPYYWGAFVLQGDWRGGTETVGRTKPGSG